MSGQRQYQQVDIMTGEVTQTWDFLPDDQLESILQRSHQAYLSARAETFAQRKEKLLRMAELLQANSQELSQIMSRDYGKSIHFSAVELQFSVAAIQHFANNAEKLLEDEPIPTNNDVQGSVYVVTPFNFTVGNFGMIISAQLMGGNAVINKPDETNYATALKVKELADQAGIGDQYLPCPFTYAQTNRILEDDRICGLSFTGSSPVGKYIGSIAARNLKIITLELGGNDPMFVFADANQDKAIEFITIMRYLGVGEICVSPKRIFVHESIHDEFVAKLEAELPKYQPGNPLEATTLMGPLARRDLMEKAISQTQDSIAGGAQLKAGGDSPGGFMMNPTLLVNVPRTAKCYTEEIFGPVVAIYKFTNDDDVVELANDSDLGLQTTLWSAQVEKLERDVIPRIQTGTVLVNGSAWMPHAPFGGAKDSGLGREGSYFGIREFQNKKAVIMNPTVA